MVQTIAAFIISVISILICLGMVLFFVFRVFVNGYIGKKTAFIAFTYVLCYAFSLFVNLSFEQVTDASGTTWRLITEASTQPNYAVSIATAFWHALKMMSLSFDSAKVTAFFGVETWGKLFGAAYVITSVTGAAFISIAIIMLFVKTAAINIKNTILKVFTKKDVYFIFSDPKVTIAKKIGESLTLKNLKRETDDRGKKESLLRFYLKKLKNEKIVIMVVTRSSLQTQEGTEYKDSLVASGFEVSTENYSNKFASYVFNLNKKKHSIWKKHKITVLGLFSDDEISSNLGLSFKSVIQDNEEIKRLRKKSEDCQDKDKDKLIPLTKEEHNYLRNFRVFITYHDDDFDTTYNISKDTLHIVNTLSEYDMISTTFILDNPIYNFVDFNEVGKNEGADDIYHVTFMGFGKINKPIFDKMCIGYQLWNDNKDKVSYHIVDINTDKVPTYKDLYYDKKYTSGKEYLEAPYLYSVDTKKVDLSLNNQIEDFVEGIKKENGRFNEKGFEVFVISVGKTHFDIKLATILRNTLIQQFKKEELARTVIFVRISDNEKEKVFREANKDITLNQNDITNGYLKRSLTDSNGEERIICPIVPYGTNVMMSDFIMHKFYRINKIGIAVAAAYDKRSEEPRDFEVAWLLKPKSEVLNNIKSAWAIQSEFKVFNLDLNSNMRITKEGMGVKKEYFDNNIRKVLNNSDFNILNRPDKQILQLSCLEHNRWLASKMSDPKILQMPKLEYIAYVKNTKFENEKDEPKTKANSHHICMTTNKGLEWIYNETISNCSNEANKKNAEVIADKLTFRNDVDQIAKVFDILYKNPNDDKKKRRKRNEL